MAIMLLIKGLVGVVVDHDTIGKLITRERIIDLLEIRWLAMNSEQMACHMYCPGDDAQSRTAEPELLCRCTCTAVGCPGQSLDRGIQIL